jgi:hypothetical protein
MLWLYLTKDVSSQEIQPICGGTEHLASALQKMLRPNLQ